MANVNLLDICLLNSLRHYGNTIINKNNFNNKLRKLYNSKHRKKVGKEKFNDILVDSKKYDELVNDYITGLEEIINKKVKFDILYPTLGYDVECIKIYIVGDKDD